MPVLYFLYSISAFLAFGFCLISGMWVLNLNIRSPANRLFFLVCIASSIWISSLLIAGAAPDYESALFWRRVAVLGWGTLFSILLHFILGLSFGEKILKRKRLYLIYTPSLICLFIFSWYGPTARTLFNLQQTYFGWTNVPFPNIWDTFFYTYYLTYSITVFIVLLYWSLQNDNTVKKKVRHIALAFLAAIAGGSVFEILLNSILSVKIPSTAHLFIIFPIAVLSREIRGNNISPMNVKSKQAKAGNILSEYEQLKFYRYLSSLFIFISIVYLSIHSLILTNHYSDVQFSLALFITGSVILFLSYFVKSERHRDNILIVTVSVCIVMMIYFFSRRGIYNYVWPFPLMIILISTLYNKRPLLYSIALISVLGNLVLFLMSPETISLITAATYVPKMVFFTFSAIIASYVHRVYLNRLHENEMQIEYQKVISRISSRLVSISEENKKECFEAILTDLGVFSKSLESFLVSFNTDGRTINQIYYWNREDHRRDWVIPQDFSEYKSSQLVHRMMKDSHIYLQEMEHISKSYRWIRGIFPSEVKALTAMSIIRDERIIGVMGLTYDISDSLPGKNEASQLLKIPSNLTSDALMKLERAEKINYMAYYDALTGLPNRSLFYDRLGTALSLAERTGKSVAVVMMDLDSFKNINDSMGHDAGDLLLRRVSEVLSGKIRDYDTMSRFGGDEFLFILSQLNNKEESAFIADKLLKGMSNPFNIAGEEFYITGSMGISCYPEDAVSADLLVKNADLAMYHAKQQGKNRFSFFNGDMNKSADEKMRLSNELYRAIERNEFILHYQPQLDVDGTEIIGMEALIRWEHPEQGLISPMKFIPLAEDTGLITEIGKWVLCKACRDNKALQDKGYPPIKVAVNLSLKQFTGSSLVEMVKETLHHSELAPRYLELEITESIAMGDSANVHRVLKELRELGITLSIDDFGTEYSSLSRLKQMEVDRIKIDKQFIQGISLNKNDESITSFIIELSKSMGLKVIAEGVENSLQQSFLTRQHCDEIQGFYFFKPMPYQNLLHIFDKKETGKPPLFNQNKKQKTP